MKNQALNKTVNVVACTLGIFHFLAQSTADLLLEGEATLVNKAIGTDKQAVKDSRQAITIARQDKIKERFSAAHARMAQARQSLSTEQ